MDDSGVNMSSIMPGMKLMINEHLTTVLILGSKYWSTQQ